MELAGERSINRDLQLVPSLPQRIDLEALRDRWGQILGLGAVLIVLGVLAIGSSFLTTFAAVVFVGWLMIVGGMLQAIHAFTVKAWSGFFVDLLAGLLYIAAGFMIVANPGVAAVALTLLIALLLMFGGLFRLSVALIYRLSNWPWLLLHGVVNLLLGIAIWRQWPLSGLWVIGLFIGIEMLLNGASLMMLGLAAKNPRQRAAAPGGIV